MIHFEGLLALALLANGVLVLIKTQDPSFPISDWLWGAMSTVLLMYMAFSFSPKRKAPVS